MTSLSPSAAQTEKNRPAARHLDRGDAIKRLDDELSRAEREPSHRFSILLVEFDGLTDTADRLGYAAEGDVWRRALRFLVQDLTAQDLCCRLSSDEFLLILSGKDCSDAIELTDRLRDRWNPAPGSRDAGIQVSVGMASYRAQGSTVEDLLCAADETLHADRLDTETLRAANEDAGTMATEAHRDGHDAKLGWRRVQEA